MNNQFKNELIEVFASITDPKEMVKFLEEICTTNEVDDMVLRWRLLQELYNGVTHRKIASDYKISLCRITRGSKLLKDKNSLTYKILNEKFGEKK